MDLSLFRCSAPLAVVCFLIALFLSCKKEKDKLSNRAPYAIAGPDQTIFLPGDSVVLDGSASVDADQNLKGFEWYQIGGPASSHISSPMAPRTAVTNLVEGIYEFELRIADTYGLFAKDRIIVTVIRCAGEYNIDETIVCTYWQVDNVEDCSDYPYLECQYYDAVEILGGFSIPSYGDVRFGIYEHTDTLVADLVTSTSASLWNDVSQGQHVMSGQTSFMKIGAGIKQGGGSFNGTFNLIMDRQKNVSQKLSTHILLYR